MSSIINEKHLMSAIKRLLALTNSDISYVIYQVMVLPDVTYNLLFCQLSFDLNVKLETIRSLFSALSTNYLYINQFQSTSKSFYTLPNRILNKKLKQLPNYDRQIIKLIRQRESC
ncbi:Hypothetical_protein [Hexamita inflata]|uniref:Hypothetical_protein n=1 Tax=Hexamita inflata TaxID=28002 RepID=A0ABP1LRR8_9EUKA